MNTSYEASWHFAPTGGGIIQGYNNAGAEHFKQDPIGKLVRETIQNSLDAHEDGLDGVVVEIQQADIDREYIGADGLKLHLQRALERTRKTRQAEGQKAYRKALAVVDRQAIPCLSIIDRNTTGLQGRKWNSLIYEEGAPEKETAGGVAGGSFGIGKNAPYNIADLHTVIYSTRYTDGKRGRVERMTGRAQLVSHQDPNGSGLLQHIGFYARKGGAAIEGPDIPTPFRLTEPGTGLWVVGFTPGRNWQSFAVRATMNNFFYAIHHRKLEVWIGAKQISYDTLDSIIDEFGNSRSRQTRHYYRAVSGKPAGTTEPVGPIGPLEVYIDSHASATKRVAYVNRRGMLITDTRERRRSNPFYPGSGQGMWPNYAAVVIAADDDTDRLIRRMENPSHDSISVDRLPDGERRKIRPDLVNAGEQIKNIIASAIRQQEEAAIDNLRELAELFPDDLDPALPGNRELEVRTIAPRLPQHHVVVIDASEADDDGDEVLDENGIVGGGGGDPGPSPRPIPPNPGPGPGPSPNPSPVPPSPGPGPNRGDKGVSRRTTLIGRTRIVRSGPSELTIAFVAHSKAGGACAFTIRPAGDEYRREKRIAVSSVSEVAPQNITAELSGSMIRIAGAAEGELITLRLDIGADAPYLAYTVSEHREDD